MRKSKKKKDKKSEKKREKKDKKSEKKQGKKYNKSPKSKGTKKFKLFKSTPSAEITLRGKFRKITLSKHKIEKVFQGKLPLTKEFRMEHQLGKYQYYYTSAEELLKDYEEFIQRYCNRTQKSAE